MKPLANNKMEKPFR